MKRRKVRRIGAQLRSGRAAWDAAAGTGFWFLSLVYLEAMVHSFAFEGFSLKFGYVLGFSLAAACVLTALLGVLPDRVYFPATFLVLTLLTVFYGSQIIYQRIFGTLYSVSLMGQGGDAITSFWRELLLTMKKTPQVWLVLLPMVGLILWRVLRRRPLGRGNGAYRAVLLVAAAAVHFGMLGCIRMGGMAFFSDYDYYHGNDAATNQLAERFGVLTTFRLELLGGGGEKRNPADSYYVPQIDLVMSDPTAPVQGGEDGPGSETEPVVEYNVMDIDFEALNAMTEDETIRAINDYCAQLAGTQKNEYTGMLKDYNLIVLCAESFSTAAIHPEVTPTLYRLANEGIIFNNYYNTFPNTTTDGEYSLCLGLYPDTTRGKGISSMYASRNSYLPFALGNIFAEQAGVPSYGYHNFRGSYYGRDESHPNMGYSMKFARTHMKFSTGWPASDYEMMQQSVDDYIGQEQFNVYYMTFSGHYAYDIETNLIAERNWDAVKKLDYSEAGRAYLSCHIELDKAMAYLMQRLEEEGIADRTAIVLASDHFPYGLKTKELEELLGYKTDSFTKHKSTLIFWVGGLEENIVVDEYCCNVDILPTILNLWGFEYDSRLLAGTDVFSDGLHMAVLIDKSFVTEHIRFDANTAEVTYLTDPALLPQGYAEALIQVVKTRFAISSDILNTGYYNFVFGKERVEVDRDTWK